MKRMPTRKSHSWWWDSHVSPKNSRWLSENLEQMDRLVKEMLKLIEEEGDSFAKKAEMYYQRRPMLLAHVEDFYRMYRALAERYDNVTGELRKNMPSDLRSQSSGNGSDFGTEPPSPSFSPSSFQTPEGGKNRPKPFRRAAGFDVFLRSNASSDFSRKGSDDSPSSSSSSSQSGSDSEDGKVVDADDNISGLTARIVQLEEDLREARRKIKEYENDFNGRCDHLGGVDFSADKFENEISFTENNGINLSETKARLEIKISQQEKVIGELKAMAEESSAKLLHQNSLLESKICSLMESEKNYEAKIQALENRLMELETGKGKACDECGKAMAELNQSLDRYKMEVDLLRSEKDELVDSKNIHEAEIRAFEDRVLKLEAANSEACDESGKLIHELNQTLDSYKQKVDILTAEKDQLNARIGELVDSKNILESKIQAFQNRVMELEAAKSEASDENAELRDELSQSLDAYKLKVDSLASEKDELNARVIELDDSKNIYESNIREFESAKTEANERAKIIEELNRSLDAYKLKIDHLTSEKDGLNARVSELVGSKDIYESKIREFESAKTEANERAKIIEELNRSLDAYKLRIDHLTSEKDELNARVSQLVDSKNSQESKIQALQNRIREVESAKTGANESEKLFSEQNQSLNRFRLRIDFLTSKKDELNARVSELVERKNLHESKIWAFENRVMGLEAASVESSKQIGELSRSLDRYKLRVDLLASEKDELDARVIKLVDDAKCADENSRSLTQQLHTEHVNLLKETEELAKRVRELEAVVESQRVLLLDGAEGKREAIRQLCFSLEHYRDRYHNLRRMLRGHGRRLAVIAV